MTNKQLKLIQSEAAVRQAICALMNLPRHKMITSEDQQMIYHLTGKLAAIGQQYKKSRKKNGRKNKNR